MRFISANIRCGWISHLLKQNDLRRKDAVRKWLLLNAIDEATAPRFFGYVVSSVVG